MTSEKVRDILAKHGRLSTPVTSLNNDSDLYTAGLTSLATVSLMLALEDAFNIEFPDSALSRKTFSSIDAITETVESLQS